MLYYNGTFLNRNLFCKYAESKPLNLDLDVDSISDLLEHPE